MKAVRFHQYGSPEVLVLDEVPGPEPKLGEVLIKVAAVGGELRRHYTATE